MDVFVQSHVAALGFAVLAALLALVVELGGWVLC